MHLITSIAVNVGEVVLIEQIKYLETIIFYYLYLIFFSFFEIFFYVVTVVLL